MHVCYRVLQSLSTAIKSHNYLFNYKNMWLLTDFSGFIINKNLNIKYIYNINIILS